MQRNKEDKKRTTFTKYVKRAEPIPNSRSLDRAAPIYSLKRETVGRPRIWVVLAFYANNEDNEDNEYTEDELRERRPILWGKKRCVRLEGRARDDR